MPRPRTLQDGLISALRGRIVAGEFAPGSRLPPRSELELEFGASRVTVQRVFDCLARDGFVVAESGSGTSVAPHPPHLCRFALVLASGSGSEGGFVEALKESAASFDPSGARTVAVYAGIDAHSDNENYLRLIRDVESHRVAGLIYVFSPGEFHDPALLENCDAPSVSLTNGEPPRGRPAVSFSSRSFMNRALDHLASLGKKRVAGIAMWTGTFGENERAIRHAVESRGLSTRPFWWQSPNPWDHAGIVASVRLLFSGPARERPDALVVTDDNVIGAVCDGIVASGLSVPRDVAIVAQANFPKPTHCRLPATRIGPDTRAILNKSVELLELQRAGKPTPARTPTHAVFSHESLPVPVLQE